MTFKNRGGEMSFNIINLLQQHVTPIVLVKETDDLLFKKQALTSFYPILLAAINSKPELFEKLRNQLEPDITDIFDENSDITQQILNYISGEASTEEVNHHLNASLAPVLNLLVSEAGSGDIQVIEHLIKGQMPLVLNALPHWSVDLLAMAGIKNSLENIREELKKPEAFVSTSSNKKKKPFPLQYVVLFIVIALLILVIKSLFQHNSESSELKNNDVASEVLSQPYAPKIDEQAASTVLVKNPLPEMENAVQPASSSEIEKTIE